jgi:ribosomal protein S27AE
MDETVLDRKCPDCGGRLVYMRNDHLTQVHCENRCGYAMTTWGRGPRAGESHTPEDAYDAMRGAPSRGRGA